MYNKYFQKGFEDIGNIAAFQEKINDNKLSRKQKRNSLGEKGETRGNRNEHTKIFKKKKIKERHEKLRNIFAEVYTSYIGTPEAKSKPF